MAQQADHNFTAQQVAEFKAAFDSWNTDGNSHLDEGEMKEAMAGLGVDVDKLGDMLKQVGCSENNMNPSECIECTLFNPPLSVSRVVARVVCTFKLSALCVAHLGRSKQ